MKTQNNLQNDLRITDNDFFNYIQSLTPAQLKGLNYKLANVKGMPITTGIGSDRYAKHIVGIERKGKTLLISDGSKYTMKYRNVRQNIGNGGGRIRQAVYTLKGRNFGHINFNTHTNYRDPSF